MINPKAIYDFDRGSNFSALMIIARYSEVKTIITSARILIKSFRLFIDKFILIKVGHLVALRKVCFIDIIIFCNWFRLIE